MEVEQRVKAENELKYWRKKLADEQKKLAELEGEAEQLRADLEASTVYNDVPKIYADESQSASCGPARRKNTARVSAWRTRALWRK